METEVNLIFCRTSALTKNGSINKIVSLDLTWSLCVFQICVWLISALLYFVSIYNIVFLDKRKLSKIKMPRDGCVFVILSANNASLVHPLFTLPNHSIVCVCVYSVLVDLHFFGSSRAGNIHKLQNKLSAKAVSVY